MAHFRRLPRAITKAGQIKAAGGRHEKDDRRRVDDRSGYVLGWTNERKISALLRRATAIQDKLNTLAAAEKTLKDEAKQASERAQILAALGQTTDFTEIDWQPLVNQIEELKGEKRDLEHASAELQRLKAELEAVKGQITLAETEKRKVTEGIGGLEHKIDSARSALEAARRVLAEPRMRGRAPRFHANRCADASTVARSAGNERACRL